MTNFDKYFIATCILSVTYSAHVGSTKTCCHDTHQEPEVDAELAFDDLEVCAGQKVTAVVHSAAGEPLHRSKIIWDGDAPDFTKDAVHRFVNGWTE